MYNQSQFLSGSLEDEDTKPILLSIGQSKAMYEQIQGEMIIVFANYKKTRSSKDEYSIMD